MSTQPNSVDLGCEGKGMGGCWCGISYYLCISTSECGGETLQTFLDRAGGNAMYTSKMAIVEFLNALGTWVEAAS